MPNDSLAARLNGKLYRIFITLVFLYAVLTSFGPMMNHVDLGWQVAQGRWIVHHGAPYSHDLFNYPNLGHPVINEYPLFEIALYTAWSLGWWGPCLLTAAVYAALLAVLVLGARRVQLPESALTAAAIGIMFLFFLVAWPLRPHVATFLGVMILGTSSSSPIATPRTGPRSGRWRCCKSRGPTATAASFSARPWRDSLARK